MSISPFCNPSRPPVRRDGRGASVLNRRQAGFGRRAVWVPGKARQRRVAGFALFDARGRPLAPFG